VEAQREDLVKISGVVNRLREKQRKLSESVDDFCEIEDRSETALRHLREERASIRALRE